MGFREIATWIKELVTNPPFFGGMKIANYWIMFILFLAVLVFLLIKYWVDSPMIVGDGR